MAFLLDTHTLLWYLNGADDSDPFDRLLIAQAIAEELTFISKDSNMQVYPVKLLW